MDCNSCEYDYACCNTDAWKIPITPEEASRISPHLRLPDGQYVLASKEDGTCFFLEDNKCQIYNKRPETCKRFDCGKRTKDIESLLEKIETNNQLITSKFSGFFVAFVFKTDSVKTASELIIKNPETGKELKLNPVQVFGQSEDEIKFKMIEILQQPFKKENI